MGKVKGAEGYKVSTRCSDREVTDALARAILGNIVWAGKYFIRNVLLIDSLPALC